MLKISPRLLSLILISFTSCFSLASDQDPYAKIEHIILDNGMNVFLAPGDASTLTSIAVEVDVGWDAEDSTNWGASHLLEHVLFRDKELKDQMSYLQVIKENGGEANGTTQERLTKYFGSIPAVKGTWMLQSFFKMILQPTINENYVEKEKSTVELEIGRPDPIVESLGFQPFDLLKGFDYLAKPDFWKSEFNYDRYKKNKFSATDERLSNRRLTANQIEKHYREYYYPSNIRLFIAGKFNRDEVMSEIKNKWGALLRRSGKHLPPERKLQTLRRPYYQLNLSSSPQVSIGTKVSKATVFEQEVLKSYFEYLTHRLMKEVRNSKAQTYTAYPESEFIKGYGYARATFKTQKEHYHENLQLVKKYIAEETNGKGLTEEQFNAALALSLSEYNLCGSEADKMMKFASNYAEILKVQGQFQSPYAALKNAKIDDYNATLRRIFTSDMTYENVRQPNTFFIYDDLVLFIVMLVFGFWGCRRLLTKPFFNDRIQWIRKLSYPPLKTFEFGVTSLSVILYFHIDFVVQWTYRKFPILNSNVYTSEYLSQILEVIAILFSAQVFYSIYARKIMVMDAKLVVKSLSYFSFSIPLEDIKEISTKRFVFHSFTMWRKIGIRYFFYSFKFWKKGLYIETHASKGYFFGVTNPDAAMNELIGIKQKSESARIAEASAA